MSDPASDGPVSALMPATHLERGLTVVLGAALTFVAIASVVNGAGFLVAAVAVLGAIFLGSLWRPTGAIIDAHGIQLVWRGWRRRLAWSDIEGFDVLTPTDHAPSLWVLRRDGAARQLVLPPGLVADDGASDEAERVRLQRAELLCRWQRHTPGPTDRGSGNILTLEDRLAGSLSPCAALVVIRVFYARCATLLAGGVLLTQYGLFGSEPNPWLFGAILVAPIVLSGVTWVVIKNRCGRSGHIAAFDPAKWTDVKRAATVLDQDIGPLRFFLALTVSVGLIGVAATFGLLGRH